ncbi:peroxisomal membrane protein PEX13-like [Choristoneura fumiferana]|uniref:peroxisomal membrane protein PEX13-like n=1 Tax=Choristoneura fumiferana TaxID=7141 RepID=UPI003D156B50
MTHRPELSALNLIEHDLKQIVSQLAQKACLKMLKCKKYETETRLSIEVGCVAENFGRLRSLFAQFWSTFAVVRSLNWLVRKLLVLLGIRTESEFKAWAEAVAATQTGTGTPEQRARGASWPILLFFGVIAAAPYIVLRMLNGLTSSVNERLNDPTSWQNPLRAVAQHDFQATSPQEISFHANQVLTLAPQCLQGQLWNSGWLMGSTDRQHAGLVPVNYIKVIKPVEEKDKEPSVEELNKYYGQEL